MVESTSGLSPVALRRHGSTRGLGGSISPMNTLLSVRDHHIRADKRHKPKHGRPNAPSSSTAAAVAGTTSSNALFESSSKDAAVKKLKGKETEFSSRNFVDLTLDSPRKDETRLAFAVDNTTSGLSFLKRHHRINRTHRSPLLSNEGSDQQVAVEAESLLLRSGSRQNLEPNRGYIRQQASLSPGERSIEKVPNRKTLETGGDMLLNASSSGAPSRGRRAVDRPFTKPVERSLDPLGSGDNKGKSSVAPTVDHQASGRSSKGDLPLLYKRKRSLTTDTAKSRQRFKPPRMSHDGSTSVSTVGGMQRPIDVENLEDPNSSCAENDLRALERARQIEEDETLARFLQHEYGSDTVGESYNMDDAQVAQMLQDEENALSLQQRAESMFETINPATLQAARGEVRRVLPTVRPPAGRPTASSSRMRILRNLHNRGNQYMMRSRQPGGRMMNGDEHLLHFPEGLGLEERLEVLAVLEAASQSGLSMLGQMDRDFNEGDYEMLLALDDTNHAHSGASNDKIEQLPVSVITPTDVVEEPCSICLETPVVDDVVRRLPCMHVFHLQCIDEWLERQANCPICKIEL